MAFGDPTSTFEENETGQVVSWKSTPSFKDLRNAKFPIYPIYTQAWRRWAALYVYMQSKVTALCVFA